ncbi:MAG: amidohydrolase family protein [Cyanobacteriota bacterium]|nr:amidohydrolase family protein [Cyanobacteriota bacterium]
MSTLPPLAIPRSLLDPGLALGPPDADGLVRVRITQRQGRVTAVAPHGGPEPAEGLPLALTPLVEAHAHLDKAFTGAVHRNASGTMDEAMAVNRREAEQRTADGVRERAERALEQAWRHGLRAIRSHIDSLGPWATPCWEVLGQLRQRWAGRVDLELVALVPLQHWLTAEGERQARRVAAAGGLLGGVLGPPYRPDGREGDALRALLDLAEREGCGVDLHVDESAQPPPRGLLLLHSLLRDRRPNVPVTASHASSMGLLGNRALRRLAEALAEAEVGVVALPTTNLWLLDRHPERTPSRRPQAPIQQLQAAGVTVAIGGDNVQDAWFPGGDFDPIELIRLATLTSHVLPWRRAGLAPLTTAPARLLHLPWDGVLRVGGPADLVVLAARSWAEVLARGPQRRVFRAGAWLPPPLQEAPSPLLRDLSPADPAGDPGSEGDPAPAHPDAFPGPPPSASPA